jgi:hypothetical protein
MKALTIQKLKEMEVARYGTRDGKRKAREV